MKTIKVRGLVLREYETGEADKRLLLLCKEHGRIMAYARGARKPRSKFLVAAQIFTYSDFVLAQGKGFYSVAQADVIESFYNIRTDYDSLCAAHLLAKICDKTLWENSDCDELLLLALKTLSNLAKQKLSPAQIIIVFLIRFLDFYGFRPHSDECAVCNQPINKIGENLYWGAEGLLCAAHKNPASVKSFEGDGNAESIRYAHYALGETFHQKSFPQSLKISLAAATAVSYILNNNLSQSFQFTAHDSVIAELRRSVQVMWDYHFEWKLEF